MGEISIQQAKLGDEKTLAYIQTKSWKAAFAHILSSEELERCTDIEKTQQMYHNVLACDACRILIESVDGLPHCIAAWGKNRCELGDDVAELICIHSLQTGWGRGYGSKMLQLVLNQMWYAHFNSVVLWVFEANILARNFYEKHGFTLTENKKMANGISELMYIKQL